MLRNHWPLLSEILAPAAVAVATALVVSWRMATSPAYMNPDDWVYSVLGRELIHGHRIGAGFSLAVLKPIAISLGVVTAPFAVEHAFQVGVGLSVAGLMGVLYFAGRLQSAPPAGFFAVAAFAVTPAFSEELLEAAVDFVACLLVVAAIATPRGRLVFMVLAGLLRPEAWIVTGIVAFHRAPGSLVRRLPLSLAIAAAAPVIWLVVDVLAAENPLRASADVTSGGSVKGEPISATYEVARALGTQGGVIIVTLGLLSLLLRFRHKRLRDSHDFVAAVVIFAWPASLVLLYTAGIPPADRYVLPAIAALSLEIGWAAGDALRGGWRLSRLEAVAGIAWIAAAVLFLSPTSGLRAWASDYINIKRSIPTIRNALACGPLGVTGHERVGHTPGWTRRLKFFVPEIAAVSGTSLSHFRVVPSGAYRYRSILAVYATTSVPPGWRAIDLPLGQLVVSPRCSQKRHVPRQSP